MQWTIGVLSLRDVLIQEHGQGALTLVAKDLYNCFDKKWGPSMGPQDFDWTFDNHKVASTFLLMLVVSSSYIADDVTQLWRLWNLLSPSIN